MLLLAAGFVGIVSAMAREARLGAGETLDPRARRRGRIAGAIAAVVVGGIVYLGNMWWTVEATAYDRYVYKPLIATPSFVADATLRLDADAIRDGSAAGASTTSFADHGHLMHLFVLSPALDRLWHLHPNEIRTGTFEQQLPALPAGKYELFADLVHATGVSETVTGAARDRRQSQGSPLSGDDSAWSASDQVAGQRSCGCATTRRSCRSA